MIRGNKKINSFASERLVKTTDFFLRSFILKALLSFDHFKRDFFERVAEYFNRYVLYERSFLKPDYRESSVLSKLLRPWLEHTRIKEIIGVFLVLWLMLFGFFGRSVSASFGSSAFDNEDLSEEISVVGTPRETKLVTEKRFQMPVKLKSVSQGFSSYHPGIDLRADYGSGVYAIGEGVVLKVYRSRYGYGQSVIVSHADGYSSMYAHLKDISVEEKFNVDRETKIAKIGLTGYTTGPHLHLEIYKNQKPINPKLFLEY